MVCALLEWSESLSYHHPQPEKIELTSDEFKKLEAEIQGSNLNTKTKEMLIKSIHFMVWLQGSLEHAKLSIKKLQKLIAELHITARQSFGKPAFVGVPCCKQIISSVAFMATVSVCALGHHLSLPLEKRLWHNQKPFPS